ncbi:MAG: hypothetical protein C7B43_03445 [Sulfobacillus benefaciens]|jgi:hypothetical protein|uniref:Uncharacterized protein n=1 Tax=Sulfobacillus benefaciens TaxID=453960 RepID=A0A2T2X9K0_9FIRM|nr:MAG: hypothetical protein C7B43_03445 [Sulfobacillus benefaciens]
MQGPAVIHTRNSLTIRLKDRTVHTSIRQPLRVKFDASSKTTGVTIILKRATDPQVLSLRSTGHTERASRPGSVRPVDSNESWGPENPPPTDDPKPTLPEPTLNTILKLQERGEREAPHPTVTLESNGAAINTTPWRSTRHPKPPVRSVRREKYRAQRAASPQSLSMTPCVSGQKCTGALPAYVND